MSLRAILGTGLAAASLLVAGNASANYHIMKIVEVMAGPGSYVELEMYSAGQTQLTGHSLTIVDPTDTVLDTIALAVVTKGDNHSRILIGTSATEATFGVKPDFATMKTLPPAGGKVCFDSAPIDCFSWGNYPNKAPSGAPFAALTTTTAAKRNVSGGATAELDGTEDTDSSAADFVAGTPAPKNNAGAGGGPADAGGLPSSSTSSSSSSSSASSTGGNPSSASSSASSGVTTGPSSSTTSSSGGAAAPAAAPADDGGCNIGGDTGALTAVPLLALVGFIAAKRRRRA